MNLKADVDVLIHSTARLIDAAVILLEADQQVPLYLYAELLERGIDVTALENKHG